jgi:hypothetical protein
LLRSGYWADGITVDTLSDTLRVVFEYPLLDPNGDTVFDDLPSFLNQGYNFSVKGRDTAMSEEFQQYMFLNGQKTLLNEYPVSQLGRWTEEGRLQFYFAMRRDTPAPSARGTGFTN